MSEFRGKLRRAFGVAPAAPPEPAPEDVPAAAGAPANAVGTFGDALRRRRERALRRQPAVPLPAIELPDGREVRNQRGACWVRRLDYDLEHRHGDRAVGCPWHADWGRIGELARQPDLCAAPADCLFLDTETTGLSGGAGTVVFLCGLGFFDAGRFAVEQVFLRAFAEEPAALAHVARRLTERPALVTFVGKTFDRHRLAARMTVHRIDAPVLTERHLDLYYLARRAWGKELPNVRLRTVEERRLGVRRVDDLPGSQAPYAFLSWLRDRTGRIDRVLEHNRLDVLSLVTLLGALGEDSDASRSGARAAGPDH